MDESGQQARAWDMGFVDYMGRTQVFGPVGSRCLVKYGAAIYEWLNLRKYVCTHIYM